MKIKSVIKILLMITGFLCVLSTAVQNPLIELYAKPMTVPLFFMLYWFSVKQLDPLFLVVLFFCFLGDIFLLTGLRDGFMYVLISYVLCYAILFFYIYQNHKPVSYSNTDIAYLMIFLIVWTVITYEIYSATHQSMGRIKPYGVTYIIILYFLLIGAVYQYINVRSPKSLWFLIAVLNFVICDTCFALDRFYIQSLELRIINSIYQLLAVYFLVKFKISSDNSLKLTNS